MEKNTIPQSSCKETGANRKPYEKPKIIYEGLITTVAGSGGMDSDPNNSDPANIFQSMGG